MQLAAARTVSSLAAALTVGLASACAGGSAPPAAAPPPGAANPQVTHAVADYKAYAQGQIDEMITKTKAFTDAVRAGDLAAAQAAYAPSRVPWERIEPIAGLVEEIDKKIDSRVDN